MAVFTITVNKSINQPPNQIGNNTVLAFESDTVYNFTLDDFTINTNPQYLDPEGDAVLNVQILTLPDVGTLVYNGINVVAGDEIPATDINQLQIVIPSSVQDSTILFTFNLSDVGSQSYNPNLSGIVKASINAAINQPPSQVGNRSFSINDTDEYVFTIDDFTTLTTPVYQDPENDSAELLKITSLPVEGILKFNTVDVIVNQVINFSEIATGQFTYSPTNNAPYNMTFNFEIADSGSGIFTS